MKHLPTRDDLIANQDRDWFDAHPKRTCRLRQSLLGECAGHQLAIVIRYPGIGRIRIAIELVKTDGMGAESRTSLQSAFPQSVDSFDLLPEKNVVEIMRQYGIPVDEHSALHDAVLAHAEPA